MYGFECIIRLIRKSLAHEADRAEFVIFSYENRKRVRINQILHLNPECGWSYMYWAHYIIIHLKLCRPHFVRGAPSIILFVQGHEQPVLWSQSTHIHNNHTPHKHTHANWPLLSSVYVLGLINVLSVYAPMMIFSCLWQCIYITWYQFIYWGAVI